VSYTVSHKLYCLLSSIVYYTSIIYAELLLRLSIMSGTPRDVS